MDSDYYRIDVTLTAKPLGSSTEPYTVFDYQHHRCDTLVQVQEYLQKSYGTCKRVKLYVGERQEQHIGYMYCFQNSDISHASKPWWQRDLVTVVKVHEELALDAFIAHAAYTDEQTS